MSQKLPTGGFCWCSLTIEDIINYDENGDTGYFVEVDAHIPPELHDYFNDMPPMPEKMKIRADECSYETFTNVRERFGDRATTQAHEKLIPNLLPKKNYVLHISTLKLYLSLGK